MEKVRDDRRLTIRMMANELSISCERVWTIITKDLEMKKICSKMIPRLLNEDKMERRVQVCHDILERLKTKQYFLRRVVTGDESWVIEYDPLNKRQSGRMQHH